MEDDSNESIFSILFGLPLGFLAHCIPFAILMTYIMPTPKTGMTAPLGTAVIYCLGSTAFAVLLWKSPNGKGVAFGFFMGVALTALATAQCALS